MPARTVVALRGGMGNQMFEYAAGRAVEKRTGAPLLLDATLIATETIRSYSLDALGVETEVMGTDVTEDVAADAILQRLGDYAQERHGVPLLEQTAFEFGDELASAPAGCLLHGYWQSERYFKEIRAELTAELTPSELGARAQEIAAAIDAAAAPAALHVRRGDYAEDPEKRANHGLMGNAYYYAASEAIANRVSEPTFFVFSDDPDWCEEHLQIAGPAQFVSGATTDVEDLALMARCHDFVIANSSFSWWGAWLGERPGSVVVAPRHWFGAANLDESDVVPARWLRL